MRWTEEEIKAAGLKDNGKGKLVRIRESRKLENRLHANNPRPMPKLECVNELRPKRKVKVKERTKGNGAGGDRFRIIVTSYRVHDIDPDNICPKYYIDALVGAGIVPGDTGKIISGGVLKLARQVKTEAEERTEIRIEKLCR